MSGSPDIAIHLYEPGDAGLDRVAILLANGFHARGYSTELWLTRREGPTANLIAPDLPLRQLPRLGSRRGPALAAQIPALRGAVASVAPRVLLSAGNQSNLPVALACRGTRTAAIAKITNPIDRPGARGASLRWRRNRFGLTARLSALTLTLSETDRQRYAAWFPAAAFAFVHNPYVTAGMAATPATRSRSGRTEIVTVGRLHEQKDQATLLRALALLPEIDWRLTVIGEGPLRAELAALCCKLAIAERVQFVGFADPVPYLARADIFALSSRWEGMPAVAVEALACGCALVTTACSPGLTELVRKLDLPDPPPVGQPAALAEALRVAATAPFDANIARAEAMRWSVSAAIDDHLRLLAPWL